MNRMVLPKFILLLIALNISHCFSFSEFKKCDIRHDFNKCLSESIHNGLKHLDKPYERNGLPNLAPLKLSPEFKVTIGNKTNGLEQTYSNYVMIGASNPEETKASFNFDDNTLSLVLKFFQLTYEFDFEADGTIILLPVKTSTGGSATFDKPTFSFKFALEKFTKDNKEYYNVKSTDLDIQQEKLYFHFKHIFDNEKLNDELNNELNAHQEEIWLTHKSKEKQIAVFYGKLLNDFLHSTPISDFIQDSDAKN